MCAFVGACIEGVDYVQDQCAWGDLHFPQPLGVAAAVRVFLVLQNDLHGRSPVGHALEQFAGQARVALHQAPLLAAEMALLVQQIQGQEGHAEVMQAHGGCQLLGAFRVGAGRVHAECQFEQAQVASLPVAGTLLGGLGEGAEELQVGVDGDAVANQQRFGLAGFGCLGRLQAGARVHVQQQLAAHLGLLSGGRHRQGVQGLTQRIELGRAQGRVRSAECLVHQGA